MNDLDCEMVSASNMQRKKEMEAIEAMFRELKCGLVGGLGEQRARRHEWQAAPPPGELEMLPAQACCPLFPLGGCRIHSFVSDRRQ